VQDAHQAFRPVGNLCQLRPFEKSGSGLVTISPLRLAIRSHFHNRLAGFDYP
jgi:hypothetical protein